MPEDKRVKVTVWEPLGQDITSQDGVMLSRAGTLVTPELMLRLSNWIVEEEPGEKRKKPPRKEKDQLKNGILKKLEFEEIVSEKTRRRLENGVHSFFETVGSRDGVANLEQMGEAVAELVEGTPDNPDAPLKLFELKQHSSYLYQHSVECGVIASFIATTLNYSENDIMAFSSAMMLHDAGMLDVPSSILYKTEPLTDEDWDILRKHPETGFDLLKKIPGIEPLSLIIARSHHVHADGTGYPADLDYQSMPLPAHLAVIINDFEALTVERPFRQPFSLYETVKLILAYRHKYHPAALESFIHVVGIYPISTFVRLDSGEVGVVVRNNRDNLFSPEVKLVLDPAGKLYASEIIVDLAADGERRITEVVERV